VQESLPDPFVAFALVLSVRILVTDLAWRGDA
jgi:hypothetical protein